VFVSYSRSDFYFAEQLAVALRRRGLDVWLDVHELSKGSDWSAAIDRAIAQCDFFVLVASRASLESGYVRRELDLAAELDKPQVAVISGRVNAPALPTYDLRSSFARGADRLARDLAAGRPTGSRSRLRLPMPGAALLVALAPALGVVFAAVLGVEFLRSAVGDHPGRRPDADIAYLAAVSSIALVGAVSAYIVWSFLRRRITWLYLRGGLFTMPLYAVVATGSVDAAASYLTSDPILIALGAPEESPIGPAPAVLAFLVVVASIIAAIATSFAAGVFRYLRTGIAPRRVRSRHIGTVRRPVDEQSAAHSYRLIAADDDARVGDEVRRSLVAAGINEAVGGDRDVVVLSDRTPSDWMSRDDLQNPVAVVATSFSLPVRGVLERFQWVDYRARRGETLPALARDLSHAARAGTGDDRLPDIPEGLQQPRVPTGVAIAEWTLVSVALFAALISTYTAARWAFSDRRADLWPSIACVAAAPPLVLLARYVRRRRITPLWLLGASALCWAAMIALGLDGVLQEMSPSYDPGRFRWGTVGYVALFAAILALTWRSLRRWLPDRLRVRSPAAPTLGYSRVSRAFLAFVVPALLTVAGTALLDSREQASPLPGALDICHDADDINAVAVRYAEAAVPTTGATRQTIVAALERRIRLIGEVNRELDRLELRTSWGVDIRTQLIAAFERMGRAERAYRRTGKAGAEWLRARGALGSIGRELVAAGC
jgi:hypothetical protein